MKRLSSLLLPCLSTLAIAQCPFTPTITPDGIILCPGETVQLSTEAYDSYQWYVDGTEVEEATAQNFIAQSYAEVTVEATLDGCTEMSAPVIVDGWVFLLPFVAHAGAEPLFVDGNGVPHHCSGDTVLLIFSYSENVQWTDGGVDIPNATNDTLMVMTSGAYSATGAPQTCPNYIQPLGLDVNLVFEQTVQPEIIVDGDELCASPQGDSYQWYLNGSPLAGGTACITAASEGSYTVDVSYEGTCSMTSLPYVATSVTENGAAGTVRLFPVPARDAVNIQWPAQATSTSWELVDGLGRVVLRGSKGSGTFQRVDISSLEQGRYWLRTDGRVPQVLQVVR
ncbi:MAG: T9SS type A sorting domain-containing protein [Flavobacteriales bacterium]|nr:T9SS type A sorting domain-containing protein [Flavobacteriales bacterium]